MIGGRFENRSEAGAVLAAELMDYADRDDVLVLGLPRGGVPVAYQVARTLRVPLDVLVVRKIGAPGHEELAIGAIASGGRVVLSQDLIAALGVSPAQLEAIVRREQAELARRERTYRGDRPLPDLRGRTVILVDDGLATGSTMRAAVAAVRQQAPARIVVAAPVAAAQTCDEFRNEVDEVVCPLTPPYFQAVGQWYEDFGQTTDAEVIERLRSAEQWSGPDRARAAARAPR